MRANAFFRRKRPACARRAFLTVLALVLASHIHPVFAQAGADTTVFTIIVTRHGVRAISPPKHDASTTYAWPDWTEVGPKDEPYLSGHGYRLMTLMGKFYRKAQGDKELPVDCSEKNAVIYADTAQRTLATARALIEGLCGSPDAFYVFHSRDDGAKDPIFNATDWLSRSGKIDGFASKAAVAAIAGSPYSSLVMRHADDFAKFQSLLDTRCPGGGCAPIVSAASLIEGGKKGEEQLAELKGPVETASSYSEDLFLEFAQCRPEEQMTSLNSEHIRAALEAGMRLHVLAYGVNARNAYNPLARGGTLLAHIAAMLDQKAGRTEVFKRIVTPDLEGKTLAIFSGHDTQLGALGGILNAHWSPEGGIVPDDMPPGSALVFDLVRAPGGEYGVRLHFATMALDQFRTEKPIEGGIKFTPVTYTGCSRDGCVMPLAQFESLGLTLEAQGFVDDNWDALPSRLEKDPGSATPLKDPRWTEPQCRSLYAYVVLGQGTSGAAVPMARVVIDAPDQPCPSLTDALGQPLVPMTSRKNPTPVKFPVTVCEALYPTGRSYKVGSINLPSVSLTTTPQRVVVLGDTGCRPGKQVCDPKSGDTGCRKLPEEQACAPEHWPFADLAAKAVEVGPNLLVHVGDYNYRGTPGKITLASQLEPVSVYDAGDADDEDGMPPPPHEPYFSQNMAKSPRPDSWAPWQEDFFEPAKAALNAAPWIFVRGNHELCSRAGPGFLYFLDPGSALLGSERGQNACPDQDGKKPLFFGQPYQITLGNLAFAVIDTANADDTGVSYPGEYNSQLASVVKNMDPATPVIVLTHRPFWGAIKGAKDPINKTLQSALSATPGMAFPTNVRLVVSGHMHRFQAMGFSDGRPPQLIVGTGGVGLSPTFPTQNPFTKDGATGVGLSKFGLLRIDVGEGGAWTARLQDRNDNTLADCTSAWASAKPAQSVCTLTAGAGK
jgi:Calcineurin-like phosphoesterase